MSSSLKERIVNALLIGVSFFIYLSVIYKLFDYREDWLTFSIMWSISWAIGYFVSKTLAEVTADESIIKVILFEALISFVVALVMSFIIGVIIRLSNWDYVVSNICFPFTVSLLINNKWKKN